VAEHVLVTGASGKLGRMTVKELVRHGYNVHAADRVPPSDPYPEQVRTIETDLLDVGQVAGAMTGCGAVIHLGAIPNPNGHADEIVFRNNTGSTFAVLQAASLLGLKRAAIASSVSAYGTAWAPHPLYFKYAPVDEAHPMMNHDVYGLSKEVDEHTAEMFCRRDGMSIAALRFHWIGTREEQIDHARRLRGQLHLSGEARALWGYVDIRDAARACRLAIETGRERPFGFAPLNIMAADTLLDEPTEDLLRTHVPGLEIRARIPGTLSGFDTSAARKLIGWEPQHSWRDAE
jgi:nucleoside-diphosphate-sugar epimerase